jgi:hypothetical protein
VRGVCRLAALLADCILQLASCIALQKGSPMKLHLRLCIAPGALAAITLRSSTALRAKKMSIVEWLG